MALSEHRIHGRKAVSVNGILRHGERRVERRRGTVNPAYRGDRRASLQSRRTDSGDKRGQSTESVIIMKIIVKLVAYFRLNYGQCD
jgi:hypothetical protein